MMEGCIRRSLSSLLAMLLLGTVMGLAAEPIKVGYIATMSGPDASLGRDILDGFNLGVEHAGDTLGGRPVEVIVGDDQLKPDVGVQVASRMLEKDKVDVIVGIVFSNVMMAVARPITEAGIFLISANASGSSPGAVNLR